MIFFTNLGTFQSHVLTFFYQKTPIEAFLGHVAIIHTTNNGSAPLQKAKEMIALRFSKLQSSPLLTCVPLRKCLKFPQKAQADLSLLHFDDVTKHITLFERTKV